MTTTRDPAPYGGPDAYEADLYPSDIDTWQEEAQPADDYQPPRRATGTRVDEPLRAERNRVDEWMDKDFKFGGSRIKRKAVALILLGLPAVVPLFLMVPAFFTTNFNTVAVSVDDTLGTGAEVCLFICLLVTPMVTLTGQRWFVPLRRWYGIMMAFTALGDGFAAGFTDNFAGGFFGRLGGHVFELMGFMMMTLLVHTSKAEPSRTALRIPSGIEIR